MYLLPPPENLSLISRDEKTEVLDHLFELCHVLAHLIVGNVMNQNYETYTSFTETCRKFLLHFLEEEEAKETVLPKIAQIISAHPRLGPSIDKLSSHSLSEQKFLAGTEERTQNLAILNELYEKTFPGLRYVVFVNGRNREMIMTDMRDRIARGDIRLERKEAFNAMCDIALDRALKLSANSQTSGLV